MEILITNGRVINGTGNPWRHADLLISGDRIADIAPPGRLTPEGVRVVDAAGRFVCPGFIDIQSHSIASLMRDGRSVSKVTQGVTTEIMGEIWTPAPATGCFPDPFAAPLAGSASDEWKAAARGWRRFGDWLSAMEQHGVSPNIGSFLSASSLRQVAMGMKMEVPNANELALMRRTVAEAMEDGAFGVSYALIYPPDCYAATAEIIEVAREIAARDGLYITHLRSESARLLEGVEEALAIGREAGLAVEIFHLKASGREAWPLMPEAIRRIANARAAGEDVAANMYPYEATGTTLSTCLPAWLAAGGDFFAKLRDPTIRKQVRAELADPQGSYDGQLRSATPAGILPVGFRNPQNQRYLGMRLDAIAQERGTDAIDTVCDLLLSEQQQVQTLFFKMSEENTRLQLVQPWVTIATDAPGLGPEWAATEGPVHPRSYGTYPRVLGRYVREEGLLTWEEAVRKMTSAVAERLRLRGRGRLERGCFADVVIFDPETVGDHSTFLDPHRLSSGIGEVFINGVQVVRGGVHTGALPGRVVRAG